MKPLPSRRPEMTERLMTETGLDEALLREVVHGFYTKVRADALLGPIFAERIQDWEPHLARMVDFWSSVALMTGRYHGTPMAMHVNLPVAQGHFERWLELFRETARALCPAQGAAHLIERAERIAQSLHMGIADHRQFMTMWKAAP
ncbi:group III truncated hemoglobin [Neogemmobacter tilapiae]|uniref:Preprotein translocase subunit TatC n=1 Tax=Neogemmobacter tilapiae TaxID=875041 RepID=A0A918TLD0_9RHOB|nr:group III truncated hemoglobin [Gemmobacter tilapiae]GHC47139.1 preprotein translocase subunit TatC [Gemmobacter tilapiae]